MTITSPKNKPLSLIPDLPRGEILIDKDGKASDDFRDFLDQLVKSLQTNFKPEGFVIPAQSTTNIAQLAASQSSNNILYDSTVQAFKGDIPLPAPAGQTWIRFAMITSYAGNPNGNIAGALYWFCWDSSDNNLYICTTAGDAAAAIWTATITGVDALLLL